MRLVEIDVASELAPTVSDNCTMTTSEELFEEYLKDRYYRYGRLAAGPDYLVSTPFGEVICEVKGRDRDTFDKKIRTDPKGLFIPIYNFPKKVIKGLKQLNAYDKKVPKVLVFHGPYYRGVDACQLVFGPYTILVIQGQGEVHYYNTERSSIKMEENQEISTVCFLREEYKLPEEPKGPYIETIHNPWAKVAVNPNIFNGPHDIHHNLQLGECFNIRNQNPLDKKISDYKFQWLLKEGKKSITILKKYSRV